MKLSETLRELISLQGESFLENPLLINILQDYNAFDEDIALKQVFKLAINEGFHKRILIYKDFPGDNATMINKIVSDFEIQYGIKAYLSQMVLLSIAYAYGIVDNVCYEKKPQDDSMKAVVLDYYGDTVEDDSEHLDFKGIAINGMAYDFANALANKGFVIVDSSIDNNFYVLEGMFAGIADCRVLLQNSAITNSLVSVSVIFPKNDHWYSLKAQYLEIKNKLVNKYGKPDQDYAYFENPYEEGDGYEMTAISIGKITYMASFITEKGKLILSIIGTESSDGQVAIMYSDKLNSELENNQRNNLADFDL